MLPNNIVVPIRDCVTVSCQGRLNFESQSCIIVIQETRPFVWWVTSPINIYFDFKVIGFLPFVCLGQIFLLNNMNRNCLHILLTYFYKVGFVKKKFTWRDKIPYFVMTFWDLKVKYFLSHHRIKHLKRSHNLKLELQLYVRTIISKHEIH
jgi:hypothetical protein